METQKNSVIKMKNDPGEKTVLVIPCAWQRVPKLHGKTPERIRLPQQSDCLRGAEVKV